MKPKFKTGDILINNENKKDHWENGGLSHIVKAVLGEKDGWYLFKSDHFLKQDSYREQGEKVGDRHKEALTIGFVDMFYDKIHNYLED